MQVKNLEITNNTQQEVSTDNEGSTGQIQKDEAPENIAPLENFKERITKKPFGIYITPTDSPIQPERFQGYHTGTDFEIFLSEENEDIEIKSICSGNIIFKDRVKGYGGAIVQSCYIDSQPVTVIYGHLDSDKSTINTDDHIEKGTHISSLADNNSYYSGYERKHLHLGIHKGENIELRGYVSNKDELADWIDFERL